MNITRKQAKELQLKRYTGKPCRKCQGVERLVSNGGCVACCAKQSARWVKDNPDKRKAWIKDNQEQNLAVQKRWRSKPQAKAILSLRASLARMRAAGVEGFNDVTSQDLGYTPSDLVKHLESLWQEGMSWSNYGEWHIDHIKPIAAFVREGVTDPAVVNALDNLQPLWAEDNFKKSASFEEKC